MLQRERVVDLVNAFFALQSYDTFCVFIMGQAQHRLLFGLDRAAAQQLSTLVTPDSTTIMSGSSLVSQNSY
jgi:hypothetical protein